MHALAREGCGVGVDGWALFLQELTQLPPPGRWAK